MNNYQDIIDQTILGNERYSCNGYCLNNDTIKEIFHIAKSNNLTLQCTEDDFVEIVRDIAPYISMNLIKVELIEDSCIKCNYRCYFFYDKNKFVHLHQITK